MKAGFFYYDEGGFLRYEPQESVPAKSNDAAETYYNDRGHLCFAPIGSPRHKEFSLLRDLPYLRPHLLRAYNERIEAAYPDGIPSELKTPHFLARYAKLHQMRAEAGAPPLAWLA